MRAMITMSVLLGTLTMSAGATEPVGWRMDGLGLYPEAAPPIEWSSDHNVVWKTKLPGWSNGSPIVIDDKLIVTSEANTVICLDRRSGAMLWTHSLDDAAVGDQPKTHKTNGYSSPTPVSDGRNVYVLFGTGVAGAVTLDGRRVWARQLQQPKHGWGHSASPTLAGGKLIVQVNDDLMALDPTTGEPIWRSDAKVRWGSPVAVALDGGEIVITPNGDVFRAADGHQLASNIGKLEYATPVVIDRIAYFIENRAQAVQLPETIDEPFETRRRWGTRIKGSRHYASPAIHDGLVYTISREEDYTVLDAYTGRIVHEDDLRLGGRRPNSAYPSVTLAGDYVFVSSENGTTAVLEAGREHNEVARNEMEGFRCSPVFIGDKMYIRAFDHMYCIGR